MKIAIKSKVSLDAESVKKYLDGVKSVDIFYIDPNFEFFLMAENLEELKEINRYYEFQNETLRLKLS